MLHKHLPQMRNSYTKISCATHLHRFTKYCKDATQSVPEGKLLSYPVKKLRFTKLLHQDKT